MKLAGAHEITAATEAVLRLASQGMSWPEFTAEMGVDPGGLVQLAEASAGEPFDVLPGMPTEVPAEGYLAGLDEADQEKIRKALEENYQLALLVGAYLERSRLFDPDQFPRVVAAIDEAQKIAASTVRDEVLREDQVATPDQVIDDVDALLAHLETLKVWALEIIETRLPAKRPDGLEVARKIVEP